MRRIQTQDKPTLISRMKYYLSEKTGLCFTYKISHITHHIINFLNVRESGRGMPAVDEQQILFLREIAPTIY